MVAVRGVTSANVDSSGTALSINAPSGTASGDLLALVVIGEQRLAESSVVQPSGFAQSGSWASVSTAGTIPAIGLFWKAAGASEPASYSVGLNANSYAYTMFLAGFTGSGGIGTAPVASTSTTSATAHVAPSLTPVASTDMLVCIAAQDSSTAKTYTTPSGMTAQASVMNASTQYVQSMLSTLQLASASATATESFTSSATNTFQAVSFTVKAGSLSVPVANNQFFPFVM